MLKIAEIREKSMAELADEEKKVAQEIFHLRMRAASGQLDKPQVIRAMKRVRARIRTVAREKELKNR